MTGFDFESALTAADEIIFETFRDVIVSVDGQASVSGIFDSPESLSKLPGGGSIVRENAMLSVRTRESAHIVSRTRLTLTFGDNSTGNYSVIKALPDGTGWTNVSLAPAGDPRSSVEIRY